MKLESSLPAPPIVISRGDRRPLGAERLNLSATLESPDTGDNMLSKIPLALLSAVAAVSVSPATSVSPSVIVSELESTQLPTEVRLSIPDWARADALDKDPDSIWGGWGARAWGFAFKGDYKRERFSFVLYDAQEAQVWDNTKEADIKVGKELTVSSTRAK